MMTACGQLGKGGPQEGCIGSQEGRTSGVGAEGRSLPQFPTKADLSRFGKGLFTKNQMLGP